LQHLISRLSSHSTNEISAEGLRLVVSLLETLSNSSIMDLLMREFNQIEDEFKREITLIRLNSIDSILAKKPKYAQKIN
jgi:hypothetical protein